MRMSSVSFRAKYTFPLENVHFLFCLCAQNNLMNIRLKGIGANITSSQTDWYTLPIILRKTSPQISFISLANHKMNIRNEDKRKLTRRQTWLITVSLWPVMRTRLAWRRWAVYNWWRGLWVVTLLMSPGAGAGVLCPLGPGVRCWLMPGERRRVSGARAEREDWAETGHTVRTGDWPGLHWPRRPLGEGDSTHHSLPSLGRPVGT